LNSEFKQLFARISEKGRGADKDRPLSRIEEYENESFPEITASATTNIYDTECEMGRARTGMKTDQFFPDYYFYFFNNGMLRRC